MAWIVDPYPMIGRWVRRSVNALSSPAFVAKLVLVVAFYFALGTWVIPRVPGWLWGIDVRKVEVSNNTLTVMIDRDVTRTFEGRVFVTVRHIGVTEMWSGAEGNSTNAREIESGEASGVISKAPHGKTIAICTGGGEGRLAEYEAGMLYNRLIPLEDEDRAGELKDINWFMASPPNPGCRFANGSYVATFTWTRKALFGLITFRTSIDSNMFRIGPPPGGYPPPPPPGHFPPVPMTPMVLPNILWLTPPHPDEQ